MIDEDQENAFHDGQLAHLMGLTDKDNPHTDTDPELARIWKCGYMFGPPEELSDDWAWCEAHADIDPWPCEIPW